MIEVNYTAEIMQSLDSFSYLSWYTLGLPIMTACVITFDVIALIIGGFSPDCSLSIVIGRCQMLSDMGLMACQCLVLTPSASVALSEQKSLHLVHLEYVQRIFSASQSTLELFRTLTIWYGLMLICEHLLAMKHADLLRRMSAGSNKSKIAVAIFCGCVIIHLPLFLKYFMKPMKYVEGLHQVCLAIIYVTGSFFKYDALIIHLCSRIIPWFISFVLCIMMIYTAIRNQSLADINVESTNGHPAVFKDGCYKTNILVSSLCFVIIYGIFLAIEETIHKNVYTTAFTSFDINYYSALCQYYPQEIQYMGRAHIYPFITSILSTINAAIKFPLLLCTSAGFRESFLKLCCQRKEEQSLFALTTWSNLPYAQESILLRKNFSAKAWRQALAMPPNAAIINSSRHGPSVVTSL